MDTSTVLTGRQRGRLTRIWDREEAAFRQELALAVLVIPLGLWLGRNGIERALLIAPMFVVLIVELLNSAIAATVDRIRLERDTGVICLEMMRKVQDAGFRVVEVPVHHYHRTHGRSQFFNFRRIFWTGIDVMKLWIQLVMLGHGRQSSPVLFKNPTVGANAPIDPPK